MPFVHIVLIKVKDSIINDEAAFTEFKKQLETLRDLDVTKKVVKELSFAPPAFAQRAQGMNYGLYSVFESRATFEEYQKDEGHVDFSRNKILPNTDNFLAYDFDI